MYTSVLERTKEIGTIKAIGGKPSHIAIIFITESGMLGILGADVRLGPGSTARLPDDVDLVVTSPGWKPSSPLLAQARDRGVPVRGEP